MSEWTREQLDRAAGQWREHGGDAMAFIARRVGAGAIDPAQFQAEMRTEVKSLHVRMAVLGNGGTREGMTPHDWGVVGHECRVQYEYLNNFTQEIIQRAQLAASGAIDPRTGQPYVMYSAAYLENRARLYAKAGRHIYERIRTEKDGVAGDALIWTLHSDAPCATCIDREGTVARRDSIPFWPGKGTICIVNCQCTWEIVEE